MKWPTLAVFLICFRATAGTTTNYFDNLAQLHVGNSTNYFDNVVQLHSGTSTQYVDNATANSGLAGLTVPTFVRAASNSLTSGSSISNVAFSVTGSNPYLLVAVETSSSTVARTVTGVTANGVAMTQLCTTNFTAHGNCYFWGLANPTSGDVIATFSGIANNGNSIHSILYNGSSSAVGFAGSFASSTRTSVSASFTSVATDKIIDFLAGTSSWTQGGSQNLISSISSSASAVSDLTGSDPSSTMSWSGSAAVVSHLGAVLHGL